MSSLKVRLVVRNESLDFYVIEQDDAITFNNAAVQGYPRPQRPTCYRFNHTGRIDVLSKGMPELASGRLYIGGTTNKIGKSSKYKMNLHNTKNNNLTKSSDLYFYIYEILNALVSMKRHDYECTLEKM